MSRSSEEVRLLQSDENSEGDSIVCERCYERREREHDFPISLNQAKNAESIRGGISRKRCRPKGLLKKGFQ